MMASLKIRDHDSPQPDAAFCHSLDLCECGHYRRDHSKGKGFCLLLHRHGWKPCHLFVFRQHEDAERILKLWQGR